MTDENQTPEFVKPPRPEPKLQPMKIVQVDGPQPEPFNPTFTGPVATEHTPGGPPARTPMNPTGKKLNMSKKEIEAAARMKKPKGPTPFTYKPAEEALAANLTRIDDLDRNTRTGQINTYTPEYDEEWLSSIPGYQVTLAWLQTAISVSGFISSETTLSSTNLKLRGLTMAWMNDGTGLACKLDNSNGVKYLFIPAANVKCVSYDPKD